MHIYIYTCTNVYELYIPTGEEITFVKFKMLFYFYTSIVTIVILQLAVCSLNHK